MRIMICLVLLGAVTACSHPATVISHPNKVGMYILSYDNPFEIASEYGEAALLSRLRAASNSQEVGSIYKSVMDDVIVLFAQDNGLVPDECGNKIELVGHSRDENGTEYSSFRCKKRL